MYIMCIINIYDLFLHYIMYKSPYVNDCFIYKINANCLSSQLHSLHDYLPQVHIRYMYLRLRVALIIVRARIYNIY